MNIEEARKIYKRAATQNLDWPERILSAFEVFEHMHGSVDNMEQCCIFVRKQMDVLLNRRRKVRCSMCGTDKMIQNFIVSCLLR